MAAIGAKGEHVIGSKSTIAIGAGNTLDLKKIYSMSKEGPPVEDVGPSGTNYSFGEIRSDLSVDVVASTPDLSTFDGYVTKDANGDFPEKTVVISFPPASSGDATVTATFTAKFYRRTILHVTEDGKVDVHFDAKITQENITWA